MLIRLPLLLFALHAPAPTAAVVAPAPATTFRSHAGPWLPLAPGLRELGVGFGKTMASPFFVTGVQAAILGGAGVAAVALQPVDEGLYDAIHRLTHVSSRSPGVFGYTLYLGEGWCDAVFLSLFSVGGPRARRVAVEGLEALAAVAIEGTVLKRVFRIPRPDKTVGPKRYFQAFYLMDSRNDAFPSGHTMSAFATAAVLSAEYPQVAPLAYAASSLVGLSVIEKGWHWPSDVVFGAALGYVIGKGAVLANQTLHIGMGPATEGIGLSASGHFD